MLAGPADFKCRSPGLSLWKHPDNGSNHTAEQSTHQVSAGLAYYKKKNDMHMTICISFCIWDQSVAASEVLAKSNFI